MQLILLTQNDLKNDDFICDHDLNSYKIDFKKIFEADMVITVCETHFKIHKNRYQLSTDELIPNEILSDYLLNILGINYENIFE